jgi:hypothetical protein
MSLLPVRPAKIPGQSNVKISRRNGKKCRAKEMERGKRDIGRIEQARRTKPAGRDGS